MQFLAEYKAAFFDTSEVRRAVDRPTRKVIVRQLAFLRRRIRSGYRRRKRASKPGQAPSVHTTDPTATLKAVFFAYDVRTQSGLVGAIKLNGQRSLIESGSALPGLLEGGGMITVPEVSYDSETWFVQRTREVRPGQKKRRRSVRVAPRPNVGPSFQAEVERGTIAQQWAGVVVGNG